jgi:CRISPR/Cas system CMR-associated protein Cmr5 small subunit
MRSLPVMIHTSGLAATAAFLLSRAKTETPNDPYWCTATLILDDAAAQAGIAHQPGMPKETLRAVAEAGDDRYLIAEARARLLAGWLSRLAQALSDPATRKSGAPS